MDSATPVQHPAVHRVEAGAYRLGEQVEKRPPDHLLARHPHDLLAAAVDVGAAELRVHGTEAVADRVQQVRHPQVGALRVRHVEEHPGDLERVAAVVPAHVSDPAQHVPHVAGRHEHPVDLLAEVESAERAGDPGPVVGVHPAQPRLHRRLTGKVGGEDPGGGLVPPQPAGARRPLVEPDARRGSDRDGRALRTLPETHEQ
jgi:hypothetical protein